MDTSNTKGEPENYCPVMECECPQGKEAAQECQRRFYGDFNPLLNWNDMAIICCSYQRREELKNLDELPPLV